MRSVSPGSDDLRAPEKRHWSHAAAEFLDALASAVSPLTNANDILATTTRMVGEHLALSCCAYADMDEDQDGFTIRGDWSAPGSPTIVGHYSLADFGQLAVRNLGAGQPLVVRDNLRELAPEEARTFQDIGIAATICMPLVKNGRLTALMAIHDKAPRQWTEDDLNLIREVTARSWAHVARVGAEAERRASRDRFRAAVQAVDGVLWTNDAEGRMTGDQPGWSAITGQTRAEYEGYGWSSAVHPEDAEPTLLAWQEAVAERKPFVFEHRLRRHDGTWGHFSIRAVPVLSDDGAVLEWVGVHTDITERRETERAAAEQARSLQVLNSTGAALAAELDLQRIVQLVTDAGVGITGAEFGAFFYNLLDDAGESYMLYALSGVDRSAFEKFPMPRNTQVFGPTFRGEGVVRSDDITEDPRYGHNAPRRGMPEGHLPVRSYLAVSVVSRSGEVIGGLFFGHKERAVFSAGAENLVRGLAGQAAVAIDNARLYQAAQREIEQRRKVEEQQLLLINELNHRAKNTLATVQSIVAQAVRSDVAAPQMREAIESRLLALSSAHDLLTRHSWEGADLKEMVERAAAPFQGPDARLNLRGPSVQLIPQAALAISMAIHELATNAVKYGALSVREGRVDVEWETGPRQFHLQWREHGGPPVSPPTRRGFGSRLLERGLAADLQGKVGLEFRSEGVVCKITGPVDDQPRPEA